MAQSPPTTIPPMPTAWVIDRLDPRALQACQLLLRSGAVELAEETPDGWAWLRVGDWQTNWVALRVDGDRLLYQCGCQSFRSHAPAPCEHVAAAAVYYPHVAGRPSQQSHYYGSSRPPKRLGRMPIAAASEQHEAYLVQDSAGKPVHAKPRPLPPIWKPHLETIRRAVDGDRQAASAWPAGREILYVLDVPATLEGTGLVVETLYREPKKTGGWKVPAVLRLNGNSLPLIPEADRDAVTSLLSAPAYFGDGGRYRYGGGFGGGYFDDDEDDGYDGGGASQRRLGSYLAARALPLLCATGRCFLRDAPAKDAQAQRRPPLLPLAYDPEPWHLSLDVERDEPRGEYRVTGSLRRGDATRSLRDPLLLTAGGLVFWFPEADGAPATVAPLDDHGAFGWIATLRERKALRVPVSEGDELLSELYRFRHLPRPNLPPELRVEEVAVSPRPRLTVKAPKGGSHLPGDPLIARLSFDYAGAVVDADGPGAGVYARDDRRVIRRDLPAEAAAAERLRALHVRRDPYDRPGDLRLPAKHLPAAVRALLADGWHVEAEGKLYRQPGELRFDVSSGIDWFDLNVTADFGGVAAPLPRLLAALRRGESMVQLDDGTFGVLPEAWLAKFAPLAGAAAAEEGDALRFRRAQAGLLDALLAAQPQVVVDETFARVREQLAAFDGVKPVDPPAAFRGTLRPYQRDSLGWFEFLRRFGFGGCLADDMGLGKTVQVLALLAQRRAENVGRPSLVVVPRSLIFNWSQEAARFDPELRVLDQSAVTRVRAHEHLSDYDLILTTYGTLRRDAAYLKDVRFDYVILDEAQAIKNADSESAKAARLLQADHRLALSGTPVQNHLGDLWSLFEFLNPGLLGRAGTFAASLAGGKPLDADTRTALARGLRPFILRRTKEQVAQELPPRQEQTIYCELGSEQRKLYDELRNHYRASLLGLIDKQGVNRSKIQILEALLRLRQAACHPALVSKDAKSGESAKLDTLIPQLQELIDGGHKALVFSQFTQFLALVKAQLKKLGVTYEYLDGKTKDRQARVERFQSDAGCPVFLISLKAGGVGLNLTAADYAFLLDPWWNPAVEAQAIDRTHRIGQTKHVFACRLIARDTVEEKVLALQQTKKDLADAIVNADNSLIRSIGREDLELLLS